MRARSDGVLFMRDIHAGILKHIFRLCIRGGGGFFFYFHQQAHPRLLFIIITIMPRAGERV